jgi:myo-inositol-1(or 4)-monophosphatase
MLETAVVAARLAGQRAMEELRYIRKTVKNGDEMVTQADPICQKLIIDRIRENFPDHGFLAEEGDEGQMLHIHPRSGQSIWWVIDPIDGTNNFANGLLCFSVSIAAIYQGKPIIGVIFDPTTDSMYTAAEDMDAQLNGSTITVSEDPVSPFSSFGIDSHLNPQNEPSIQQIMESTRFRSMGSTAIHLAYVAKGALIGTICSSTRLWDFAAGAVLVERAGGVIFNRENKNPFPVDPQTYQGQSIPLIATSKKVQSQILEIFTEK